MIIKKYFPLTVFVTMTLYAISYGQSVEDLSKTVVFLCQEIYVHEEVGGQRLEVWLKRHDTGDSEQKVTKATATGFVVKHNGRDYLVTAKHVALAFESNKATGDVKSTTIVLNQADGKVCELDFAEIQRAKALSGAKWFYHSIADIAVHPLGYPKGVTLDLSAIKSSDCPKVDKQVPLLSSVYVLGFPLGIGAQNAISPVAKETHVASNATTLGDLNIDPRLKWILLDEALARGYSGAPVFCIEEIYSKIKVGNSPLKAGEKIHLIGIQSLALSDATGGKLSTIVPISYLWDVLQSHDFLQYEKNFKPKAE
jgi:S1-C subfamily serine protease